ncbi:MAG: hypothetical protein L0Z07_04430 [Planctomycetes bacterium]|jgi:hypothetical protein|nr:hypothetical protein [Planctomycetota bacterium]
MCTHVLAYILPLLAQPGSKSYSMSWGIVLFWVIAGLLVTLSPSRRKSEIKRPKDQ